MGDGSDMYGMAPHQKRAVDKGLTGLDAMAALWAEETDLRKIAKRLTEFPADEGAKCIEAMVKLAFIEGAFRHFMHHQNPWLSLAEGLPSEMEPIFFCSADSRNLGDMMVGVFRDGKFWSVGTECFNVTHWYPRPAYPRVKPVS